MKNLNVAINIFNTSNSERLGSGFDDLAPGLFAKLMIMSSAPAKSAGDARYASQDPFVDR